MTPSLVPLLLATSLFGATIQGTVRMSGSDGSLGGVRVEVDDGVTTALTDSSGAYELADVLAGPHRLRFSRLGYAPFTVEVFIPADGQVRLDVELLPGPVALKGIEAVQAGPVASPDSGAMDSLSFPEIGFQRVTDAALRANSFSGETDVIKGLVGSPGITLTEVSNTLHVRGGSGDQNLTLIDGVPIYGPYHSTDVLTAVNPDAVASAELHTAAPSARFGGRLAGVEDLLPRPADRRAVEWRGRAGLTAVGQMVDGPLPFHLGGFLLSARRSYRDLFEPGAGDPALGFEDRLGDVTIDLPHGNVQLLLFQNINRLAFDGRVGAVTDTGAAPGASLSLRNRFGWTSTTAAAIWRDTVGLTQWEAKAWHADLRTQIVWGIAGHPAPLTSRFAEDDFAAAVTRGWRGGRFNMGVSLEGPRTSYDLGAFPGSDSSGAPGPSFALSSARTVGAAFVENRWLPARRWAVSAGLRADVTGGEPIEIEPRLSVRFAALPSMVLSLGYARTVQYVQSLRNEESVLDVIFGADLLVGAGSSGIPVAHADQVTAAVEFHVSPNTRLVLDGYAKRLEGLALVAPTPPQPFATARPLTGRGEARGALWSSSTTALVSGFRWPTPSAW